MASNLKDSPEHYEDTLKGTQSLNDAFEYCVETQAKEKEEEDCRNGESCIECPYSFYALTKQLALIHEDVQAPLPPETNYLTPTRPGIDSPQKSSISGSENRLTRVLSSPKLLKEALRSPFRSLRRGRRPIHASTSDIFSSQDCSPIPLQSSPLRAHPFLFERIPTPPGAPRLAFSVLHKEPGLTMVAPPPETPQSSLSPALAVDSPIGISRTRTTVRDSAETPAGPSSSASAPITPERPPRASLTSSSVSPDTTKITPLAFAQARAPTEMPLVSFGVHEAQVAIRARPKLIDTPTSVGRGRSIQISAPGPNAKRLASPFQVSSARIGS